MGLKKLVICGEANEVLFAGTSSTAPSGLFPSAASAEEIPNSERLTLPAPPVDVIVDDDDDDAPTITSDVRRLTFRP